MSKFLEPKIKKEYPDNTKAVHGTLNKVGVMKGNRETPKGKELEQKHKKDKKKKPKG